MTPAEERRALKDRCDAMIREFDAAHPDIALAVKMHEESRAHKKETK